MSDLITDVEELVTRAVALCREPHTERKLRAAEQRLREPLRVAIAGKVKAGKSTLLNALVGEQLAPTDAGECTRIVTWYQYGQTYRVTMHMIDGTRRRASFTREGGAIEVDLKGMETEKIERMVVEWPTQRLADMTLIDTPGVASIDTMVSDRTLAFLTPDDDRPVAADAVLYLMKHMHADDLLFLEAFHDDELAHPSPVNAIGVLSRADEVAVGRPDAMRVAARIAQRYRADDRLRRLCQTVLPLAGLLSETAATLTQDEYEALELLAGEDRKQIDALMLSADRFVAESADSTVPPLVRRHLLDRLGMFGIRVALPLIRQGRTETASVLASRLAAKSGIVDLRQELLERFAERRDVLRARSVLLAVERLAGDATGPAAVELRAEIERIRVGAHALAEIRLLNDHRRGLVSFTGVDSEEVERLLGSEGVSITARLGLPPGADPATIRAALLAEIERWRRTGDHPLATREAADAAALLVRTCEGALSELGAGAERRDVSLL
ncbi:MAG: dynamin family protein [Acidimicrobiales bacterium]